MVSADNRRCLFGLVTTAVIAVATPAAADEPADASASPTAVTASPTEEPQDAEPPLVPKLAVRRKDATAAQIMRGPYRPSQLFAMPIADVVGAYQMMLSGDGSLLQEQGILSFAGVAAVGFGDLAQLEFRHTAAISIEGSDAPLPTLGVQLKLPIPEKKYVPSFAVAFRYGVQRQRTVGATSITESVTDGYFVGRLALWGFADRATLHAGLRVSQARILAGDRADCDAEMRCPQQYVYLPTFGLDVRTGRNAQLIFEAGLAPRFKLDTAMADAKPAIGTGVLGRLGVRWFLHPAFSFDASMGYQLEVPGSRTFDPPADRFTHVIGWDIRIGAQFFLPWGAFACKQMGLFCE